MAVLKQIDASTFPTSGAATTGTTGLFAITGGTHVGSTDLPSGSTATGYIASADGGALSFRMDTNASSASGLFGTAPSAGDKGLVGFWYYAEVTDTTLAAVTAPASGVPYAAWSSTYGSSPTISLLGAVIKNVTEPLLASGIALFTYPGSGTASRATAGLGFARTMNGGAAITTDNLTRSNIPLGRWVYLTLEIVLGTGTNGKMRLNINGQRVSESDIDTGTTATTVNNVQLALPAITGIKHRIIPDNSWRSTGHPSFTTIYKSPTNCLTAVDWPVTFCGGGEGDNWTVTYSGGSTSAQTGTRPLFPQSSLGADSERSITTLKVGESATYTSKKVYGTLDYNDEGWAFVCFRRIMFRADSEGVAQVKNAGGTVVGEVYWNFNSAAGRIRFGSAATDEQVCYMPPSGSEGIVEFGFNSDGRAIAVVWDTSSNPSPTNATARKLVGYHRFTWTPANIGNLVLVLSMDAYIGSGTTVVEFGGASFERYTGCVAADSWTEEGHFLTGYDYITWSGGAATVAVNDVLTYAGLTTHTVIACNNAAKWAVTYGNNQPIWPAATTLSVSSGSTITGVAAATKISWVSHGAVTGTFSRNETVTETTTGITGKLVMSGTLDSTYVPASTMGFGGASGQFRGGLTLTGGTSGATCTGDLPHNGMYRATIANGKATAAYNCHRDCEAAAVVTPFAATSPAKTITLLIPLGRAGKYPSLIEEGIMLDAAAIPGRFVFVCEGMVNALVAATTVPLGLSIAAREADAVLRMAAKVASNEGRVLIELPTFNASGSYGFNQAGAAACVAEYRSRIINGVKGINYRGRIELADIGNEFPTSTDGVHPNSVGRAELARRVNQNRRVIGGSGARNRASR